MTHRKCNQTLFVQLSNWKSPKFLMAITCGYSLSTRFLRTHLRARHPPRIMLPQMMLISRVRRHTEELAAPNSSSSLPTLFTARNTIAFNIPKRNPVRFTQTGRQKKNFFFGQTNWSLKVLKCGTVQYRSSTDGTPFFTLKLTLSCWMYVTVQDGHFSNTFYLESQETGSDSPYSTDFLQLTDPVVDSTEGLQIIAVDVRRRSRHSNLAADRADH